MRRTQILLEDWQYQALQVRAEQENRSISDLVREILLQTLTQPSRGNGRLEEIDSIAEDPIAYGRTHDHFLYGEDDQD